ncbi:general substrate transporter [Hypomontagnella monticulosa]|nr:general substrate transporter [Hypomontagnella monticulosa]
MSSVPSQPNGADPPPPQTSRRWMSQKTLMVWFSSIAIGLYGYDQGMMSLINTNRSYLRTMNISEDSALVGVIVSVYYLGCVAGAIIASHLADKLGRKASILTCLLTSMVGDIVMFVPGIYPPESDNDWNGSSLALMITGRIVLGLGIGGIDAVIPVYSSELSKDGSRGSALAKEFQANIAGLCVAFALNLILTYRLGKDNQWAWRVPIVFMQIFPVILLLIVRGLPESPRWLVSQARMDDARDALEDLHGETQGDAMFDELYRAQFEEPEERIGYLDMLWRKGSQFHPSMIVVMGQVNQALTGYGAVSVYGPQIFELLGLDVREAEWTTLGNYIVYFLMMTVAWKTIDVYGRRKLMVWGSAGLAACFAVLAVLGGISVDVLHNPKLTIEILGSAVLFLSTSIFGVTWLTTAWLIPTEIYPTRARAQGSAISVIIWGFTNFAVTLLTPIGFNNLKYWLFLVFAMTNTFAGWMTWRYSPETGGRSFEENQKFFIAAREVGSCVVKKVDGGKFLTMPPPPEEEHGEAPKGNEDAKSGPTEATPLLGDRIEPE